MKKKWQLIIGLVLALVVTCGVYAFTYTTDTVATDVTEAGLSSATWYEPTGTGDYYTSGPGDDTPTLSDISITYSAEAVSFTVEVTGGSYCLVSTDTSGWEAGWTVTPESYCQLTQRWGEKPK